MAKKLSEYAEHLESASKIRYIEKINSIDGIDPYTLKESDFNNTVSDVPKMYHEWIVDYLIYRCSTETQQEIRSYKGLSAYKQVACKWVLSLLVKRIGNNFLLCGKVLHSQRINDTPLRPWVVLASEGHIICGHCNCVAGLGEVCTHVAALLFMCEKLSESASELSRTDVLAYWTGPKTKERVHLPVDEINWKSPESILKGKEIAKLTITGTPEMSADEVNEFLRTLHQEGHKCVIHETLKEFSGGHAIISQFSFDFYNETFVNKTLQELQNIPFEFSMTDKDCASVEKVTRDQSLSDEWFIIRAGRITASRFKAVCRTRLNKPSISLIRHICYPSKYNKGFKQTIYGCDHEKDALTKYINVHEHEGATTKKCGFFINPEYPHMGASPDAILICNECGEGLIEIKCPWCMRNSKIEDVISQRAFCLKILNDKYVLPTDHQYYYQIQMQMAISKMNWCDFVVWSKNDFHVQRIHRDVSFWAKESEIATNFFKTIILPELRSKCFTSSTLSTAKICRAYSEHTMEEPDSQCEVSTSWSEASTSRIEPSTSRNEPLTLRSELSPSRNEPSTLSQEYEASGPSTLPVQSQDPINIWCICKKEDDGSKMVLCEGKHCTIKWFHRRCIKMKKLPKGPFYCDQCKLKT